MKITKLPNNPYLVFSINSYNGYSGLSSLVFSYKDEKSGLDKLRNFLKLNRHRAEYCSYEVLIVPEMKYITFSSYDGFESYLIEKVDINKKLLIQTARAKCGDTSVDKQPK